ncbi:MAG: sensor histidine kinase, partial [Desulfomonilaceae bacterium]
MNAELLKAVAELATGVSHNFNNILQRILACCQSAIIKLDVGDHIAARSLLTEILENSKNGSETVKRLQSFAQLRADVTSYTNQVFDLTTVVKDALGMTDLLNRTLAFKNGVSISIEAELIDGLMVSGISNDLFEVALNLMRNAIESISENGVIKVRTYAQENSAILEVEDNGSGISLENLGKIFDPFFTTKGFQSTGMGL